MPGNALLKGGAFVLSVYTKGTLMTRKAGTTPAPILQPPEKVWARIMEYEQDILKLCANVYGRMNGRGADWEAHKCSVHDMRNEAIVSIFGTLSRKNDAEFAKANRKWFSSAVSQAATVSFFRKTGEHRQTSAGGKQRYIRIIRNIRDDAGHRGKNRGSSYDEVLSEQKIWKKF